MLYVFILGRYGLFLEDPLLRVFLFVSMQYLHIKSLERVHTRSEQNP